jgi:hypothetical protein
VTGRSHRDVKLDAPRASLALQVAQASAAVELEL